MIFLGNQYSIVHFESNLNINHILFTKISALDQSLNTYWDFRVCFYLFPFFFSTMVNHSLRNLPLPSIGISAFGILHVSNLLYSFKISLDIFRLCSFTFSSNFFASLFPLQTSPSMLASNTSSIFHPSSILSNTISVLSTTSLNRSSKNPSGKFTI